MKAIACIVLGLLMVCGGAIAQQKPAAAGSVEAALMALEEKWDVANTKGDAVALGALLADTFISTNSEGKVRAKAEVLAQLKSGEVKFQASKVDDMKVHVHGDAAVVNGRWTGKFVEKGKNVATAERFTDTWVRQNGQWRCVASQSSVIK